MQGFDVILGAILIGFFIVLCAVMWWISTMHERAAKGRLKWLRRHLKHPFSLSYAWRWHYRNGHRRGKKQGIEIGRQQTQRIVLENRCEPHKSDLYPQLVRLDNGSFVQGWFCTNWEQHTVHVETGKIEHPFAAARFAAQK